MAALPYFLPKPRYGVTFSVLGQEASICFTTLSGKGT